MSKFRKLISSVAAASIAASMFTSVSLASVPSDVVGTEFENQAVVLGALEIMVGDAGTGTFRPNDAIIRSEVAKVGVALMGLSQVADSSADVSFYPDVDASHWANGFINVATAQKLVIGDDTGTFRPDDQIKYSEAVAILVRALGYEPQAISKGGYPSGYLATANLIGLTKGVAGTADKLISRGDVAKLSYNALNINLMEQTGFGDKVNYEITDKTLLEDKLDAELVSGKVEAVGSSVLDGSAEIDKNEIKIDGKIYNIGNADVRNVLGFNVDAYVSKKSGKTQNLLALIPSEGKNKVISISADNIDRIENTDSSMAVYYFADKENSAKATKATINTDAYIVYNGKAADKDKLKDIDSGSIVLLDSDSNSKYDVVFVNETVNYVVDEVYPSTNKITDKYGLGTLELDIEDESKTIILEKGNEKITVSELKEWDVLTVTMSEDSELIYVTAIHKSIEGKVSEKNDTHVYINGEKYSVAANLPVEITLDTEGVFYLDYEGKIAAFDGKTEKSSNYAFLEDAAISNGIDKVLNLKIFTKEGELLVLNTGDKVRVDGVPGLSPEKALEKIGEDKKLITYDTNSKGIVTKINTYKESSDITEDEFVLNLKEENVVYRASSSKLIASDMTINVGNNTIIFDIPSDKSAENYAVRDKKIFADGGLYDIMVFDMTQDHKASVIIVTNSEAKADEESSIAVINKITSTKTEDDGIVYKIYAFIDGKEVTFTSENEKTFVKESGKLLSQGDIIQIRTNAKGEVDAMTVLFDTNDKETEFKNEISDNLTTVYGKITKKFSDSINVQVNDRKSENYSFEGAAVYVYDTNYRGKVRVGDTSDLQSYANNGGRVFLKIFKDVVKEIVVIK